MISVVPYAPQYLSGCADLYPRCFPRSRGTSPGRGPRWWRTSCSAQRQQQLPGLCSADGRHHRRRSIGFLKPYIRGVEYYIDEYFVDSDRQGQGIGTQLLADIRADLRQKGIPAIILNTERNAPAYRFYRKAGFEELEGLVILAADAMGP